MKPSCRLQQAANQQGSIMVYCLGLLVLMALALGYSYNASRVSAEKTRLQNTADAAAYSVAVVESRDLNFKAYTNRAMVANQVAIAQSISLVSWSRFVKRYVENISIITSWIPYVGAAMRAASQGVTVIMQLLEKALEVIIPTINELERVLSAAQSTHHGATVLLAHDVFKDVVEKNDPAVDRSLSVNAIASMGKYVIGHQSFTERYSPGEVTRTNKTTTAANKKYEVHKKRMDEFRLITLASRDGFSKNRTYNYIGTLNIPFGVQFKVRKAGGSELTGSSSNMNETGNYYTWSAMDTMSAHLRRFKSLSGWSSWKEASPIGWGAAATQGGQYFSFYRGRGGANGYGRSYRINPKASGLATTEYMLRGPGGMFDGLRSFYDIRQDGLVSEAAGIALVLTKPHSASAAKTIQHAEFGGGAAELDLEAEGNFYKDRLTALSQAVPYFSRPNDVDIFRRQDRLREYGNLYNPFWQPRLSELKLTDRENLLILAGAIF